jgi:hypothetical protein
MARFQRIGHHGTLVVLLGLTLLSGGCHFAGVSEAGRERCRKLSAQASDPIASALAYARCLPSSDRELAIEAEAAARAAEAKRQALLACGVRRQKILALMASLRASERELAAARNAPFLASLPPPPPIDESAESRYRLEDQQLDRQRRESALAAWEERVAGEKARWRNERSARIARAREHLDRDRLALKGLEPDLFTGTESIEFNPAVVRRATTACEASG